jgi:flagellar basal-body rod modification protein FlgD
MNINGISSLMNTSATTGGSTSTTSTKKSEKDTFMTLLVEQLKHQDPTQPQDGAQFVTQLAQFNSLDQLVSIKDSINQLLALSKGADGTTTTTTATTKP